MRIALIFALALLFVTPRSASGYDCNFGTEPTDTIALLELAHSQQCPGLPDKAETDGAILSYFALNSMKEFKHPNCQHKMPQSVAKVNRLSSINKDDMCGLARVVYNRLKRKERQYISRWMYVVFDNGIRPPARDCDTSTHVRIALAVGFIERASEFSCWRWPKGLNQQTLREIAAREAGLSPESLEGNEQCNMAYWQGRTYLEKIYRPKDGFGDEYMCNKGLEYAQGWASRTQSDVLSTPSGWGECQKPSDVQYSYLLGQSWRLNELKCPSDVDVRWGGSDDLIVTAQRVIGIISGGWVDSENCMVAFNAGYKKMDERLSGSSPTELCKARFGLNQYSRSLQIDPGSVQSILQMK